MVKPASLSRLTGSLTCLALLWGGANASAQQKATDDKPAESEEAVFIPVEYRPPPWQASIGVRLSGKAKVKFSGLGALPSLTYAGPDPDATAEEKATQAYKDAAAYVAAYGRNYDNGAISPDSTYQITSDQNATTVTYGKVDQTDGKTNVWQFTSADQVVTIDGNQALALKSYEVVSAGSTFTSSQSKSVAWDIEVSRALGSSKRMSWGIVIGAALGDINASASATINAKLRTITDYYALTGVTLPTDLSAGYKYSGVQEYYPYTLKLEDDGVTAARDANGNTIPIYQYDQSGNKIKRWSTAERISTDPIRRDDVTEETPSVVVNGFWQVKGSYLTARFGPYFAYEIAPWLSVRASAGLTFTILGANLWMNERAKVLGVTDYLKLSNEKLNLDSINSGILGYFVSGEVDAFLTNRTGVFIGVSHEDYQRDLKLQYYTQTADLTVSTGTILRTGITTRF